jgi:Protein of unknown function (DUF2480)
MPDEIINKVANSQLLVFDLEDYYTAGTRVVLDLSQWLEEGILLREKPFRENLKNYDWAQYQNKFVVLYCSDEIILPAWATVLITTYLTPFAKKTIVGSLNLLESLLYQEALSQIDFSVYQDKAVIVKGCSKKPVPENAYLFAVEKLMPFAKSIMYGEACSAVPLYKKRFV